MNTDLVRHKDRWALGVKEMRDIFLRLENEGFSRETQLVSMLLLSNLQMYRMRGRLNCLCIG